MRKVIIIFALLLVGLTASAQFKDFFRPVTNETFIQAVGTRGVDKVSDGAFILRPTVAITAVMYKIDENNQLVSSPLARAGIGVSYAHYIQSDGQPYNNYSINALLMFPTDGTTNLATALTVSAMKYVNIGVGYDFIKDVKFKQNLFFLTGVQLTF